jgi:hypothetical protein
MMLRLLRAERFRLGLGEIEEVSDLNAIADLAIITEGSSSCRCGEPVSLSILSGQIISRLRVRADLKCHELSGVRTEQR